MNLNPLQIAHLFWATVLTKHTNGRMTKSIIFFDNRLICHISHHTTKDAVLVTQITTEDLYKGLDEKRLNHLILFIYMLLGTHELTDISLFTFKRKEPNPDG